MKQLNIIPNPNKIDYLGGSVKMENIDSESFSARLTDKLPEEGFRENRAIPLQAKIVSVSLIWLTMGYCIFRVVDAWWWAQLGLFLLAVGTSWHILSFATLKKKE